MNKKKKILIVNYEFPPLGGGAGNATKNIAKELAVLGHKVLVLTTWFKNLPENEFLDNYKIIRVKSRRKRIDRSNPIEMISFVFFALKKINVIKEFKADFSIAFFSIPSGLVSYCFKKKLGIPYIVSLRGGDVPGFLPKNLKYYHLLTNKLTKLIWKNSIAIVANSVGLKQLANKTAKKIKRKVEMIANGVDINIFKPILTGKRNKVKLLFVGRIIEQKRVDYLIKVLKEVVDSGLTNLYCEIIGDGPLKNDLLVLVRQYGLEKYINFLGWIEREKLPKYYQNSDVFVLPSSYEGMPNVLLEAIASGLPIIASNISGNNELVKSSVNGFLFNNKDELSEMLKDLIKDKDLRQKMSAESLKLSKEYSWTKVAEEYLNIFKINSNRQ